MKSAVSAFSLAILISLSGAASDIAPMTSASAADLLLLKQRNDRDLVVLREQIDMQNEYMASHGQSLAIRVMRHSDTFPEYVVVLGAVGGGLTSGAGLLEIISKHISPRAPISQIISNAVAKRCIVIGVGIIVISSIGAYAVDKYYSGTPRIKAFREEIRQLDSNSQIGVRNSMTALMVRQLAELEQQNQDIETQLRTLRSVNSQ